MGFRDFETMVEVAAARQTLDEIEIIAETCFDRIGIPRPHEARPELAKVFASGLEDITLKNLVLTGFVNLILHSRFDFSPLTPGEVEGLFGQILGPAAEGRRTVRAEARGTLLDWLARASGFEGAKLEALEGFVDSSLRDLEDEIGGVR